MENHEYKLNLSLSPISKEEALDIVKKMHYSNTLPSITKEALGVFIDEDLEGVITLGYGTRPKHTIRQLFPSLDTKDYFEIGRMCINDKFKTNTESQMLSKTVKYIKKIISNVSYYLLGLMDCKGKLVQCTKQVIFCMGDLARLIVM